MNETKTEARAAFWAVTTFLERAECVFDHAILSTPTGDTRNKFTDLNIERMLLIENSKGVTAYAKRLRALLDKIVANEKKRDEMSCDCGYCLGDVTQERDNLVAEIVKLMCT